MSKQMEQIIENPIIANLLEEFTIQRDELKKMIEDLEKLKENIGRLFPTKLDLRHSKTFEEKIKTATALFNVLLDIRKEVLKSIKEELEVRRKIEGPGGDINIEDLVDVRKLVASVEALQDKKNKLKVIPGETK